MKVVLSVWRIYSVIAPASLSHFHPRHHLLSEISLIVGITNLGHVIQVRCGWTANLSHRFVIHVLHVHQFEILSYNLFELIEPKHFCILIKKGTEVSDEVAPCHDGWNSSTRTTCSGRTTTYGRRSPIFIGRGDGVGVCNSRNVSPIGPASQIG